MNKETETSADTWDIVSRIFHWVSALWVFGLIGIGLVMVNLVQASGPKFELYQLHKSYGFLFGLVLIARLLWKLAARRPKALDAGLLQTTAIANQNFMLALLTALIVTGYAAVSFSVIPIPIHVFGWNVPSLIHPDMAMEQKTIVLHHYAAFALMALVLVHSGAALFHHFILKDRTLIRMLK